MNHSTVKNSRKIKHFVTDLTHEFIDILVFAVPLTCFMLVTLVSLAWLMPDYPWGAIVLTSILTAPVLVFTLNRAAYKPPTRDWDHPVMAKKTTAQCIKDIEEWDEDVW
jgi:hypothetical protein